MENTLLGVGITCIIAAIVGGGLKAFGMEVSSFDSVKRQVLLALFGLVLVISVVYSSTSITRTNTNTIDSGYNKEELHVQDLFKK